ncbi:hypothetical protein OBBRIDRAFT_834423 [Obba rivulosa]|uniref:BTB domain-containing protein n=1 Tax=Obba rivulosa TaxID=1052685 RepID=A0A8E2DL46_9APHY|nr:hypothetical protein OBBRIDRAFT_834423 [Obba rivulosa]
MSAKLQVDALTSPTDPIGWRPKRSRFFLDDDELIIFKAEDTLFRVHRYFLERDSELFRGLFSCPPGKGGAEGKTEERPVELPGVDAFEFECLLDFLYDGMYALTSPARTIQQWMALLSISSRFMFDKIRAMTINALSPRLDAMERIALSSQFDIPQWLKPALVDLCMREKPLSDDEGRRIGFETSLQIARARESFQAGRSKKWCSTCTSDQSHIPFNSSEIYHR